MRARFLFYFICVEIDNIYVCYLCAAVASISWVQGEN